MSFWICALCVCARNGATSSALAPTSNSIRFIGCYLLMVYLRAVGGSSIAPSHLHRRQGERRHRSIVRCALAYSSGLLLSSIEFRMAVATGLCLRDQPLEGGGIHHSLHQFRADYETGSGFHAQIAAEIAISRQNRLNLGRFHVALQFRDVESLLACQFLDRNHCDRPG